MRWDIRTKQPVVFIAAGFVFEQESPLGSSAGLGQMLRKLSRSEPCLARIDARAPDPMRKLITLHLSLLLRKEQLLLLGHKNGVRKGAEPTDVHPCPPQTARLFCGLVGIHILRRNSAERGSDHRLGKLQLYTLAALSMCRRTQNQQMRKPRLLQF